MITENLTGRTIDDFQIVERIGQGGMAAVYRAHQLSINRDVALKIINIQHDDAADQHFRERFANEAAIIASLEHIHILPVYAYGISGTYAYLAMRMLRGGSVKDLLWGEEPLPLEQAVRLFDQVAQGLAHAHSKGVIHRDLKPANILLDDHQNAYLTDFGLARMIDSEQHLTRTDNVVGTLAYMSPEHLRGDKLDHRADIYSMGVVLYHMLTGRVPFRAGSDEDMVAVIYKHLEEEPVPPQDHNSDISDELDNVILKALAKDPAQRFQSMGEMALAVRLASGLTFSTSSAPYPGVAGKFQTRGGSSTTRKRRRKTAASLNTILAIVTVVLVLVALALVVFSMVTTQRQADIQASAVALAATSADETAVAAQTATAAAITPTDLPLPDFEVLANTTDRAENLTPTDEQIERAQRRLGEDGFVAVLACNMSSEYHATFNREIIDFARQYGLNFRIYDSDSDGYQQRLELEKAQLDGAKGIILCPLDMSLLDETLQDIEEKHIPLASNASNASKYGGIVTGVIDYEMGLVAGRAGGEIVRDDMNGSANVIILDYPDLPSIVDRANGLENGLQEFAPEATIIGRYKGGTADFAYESVSKLIRDDVEFNFILSINDAGSYGAIKAMEEAGIALDAVTIVSVDAEQQAKQFILDGRFIRASLAVARTATAKALVDAMTRMLAGTRVADQIIIPPGEMVTRETLANERD